MIGSPALYNVGTDYLEGDPALVQKRGEHSSLDEALYTDMPQPISSTLPPCSWRREG